MLAIAGGYDELRGSPTPQPKPLRYDAARRANGSSATSMARRGARASRPTARDIDSNGTATPLYRNWILLLLVGARERILRNANANPLVWAMLYTSRSSGGGECKSPS